MTMKKTFLFFTLLLLASVIGPSSCSYHNDDNPNEYPDPQPEPEPEPEPQPDVNEKYLEASYTPNCFMVKPGESVDIPVLKAYAIWDLYAEWLDKSDFTGMTPEPVLLWQDTPGLITNVGLIPGQTAEEGSIFVSTADKVGNALIGLRIGGEIRWSWHIWVCNDEITAHDHIDSEGKVAAVIMDRNLGALNNTPMDVGNRGMFYEWGRKDPFTPSRSPYHADTDGNNVPAYNEPNTAIGDGTGTWVYNAQAAVLATPPANIPNSILNPMTYLQSPYNGHADWYCTGTDPKATHPGLWGPEKTIFDPCPPGYKVPGPDLWGIPAGNNSITNGGAAADYDETGVSVKWDWNAYEDCGRRWKNTGDYYPMAGNIYYTDYISVSICNYTGGMAFYWTAQATPDATKSSAYFVNFNPNWCNYRLGAHDCSAQIRCIRE